MEILIIFIVMFVFFVLGVPMAFGILASTVLYLFFTGDMISLFAITSKVTFSSDSYALLAVPFFMLSAALMNESKITKTIFNFAKSLVGHIPGGLGHVVVVASIIFAGMSGSSIAHTAGLGRMQIKAMLDDGYDPAFCASITASSALIGPIIPPSICMVIAAVMTNNSVGRMLLGGIIPGILMGFGLMVVVYFFAVKRKYPVLKKATVREIVKLFWESIPALLTPIILVGGILSGFFTPTEASVIAVVYALIVSMLYYRDISIKKAFEIFKEIGTSAGSLLFVIAAASAFGLLSVRLMLPQALMKTLLAVTTNPTALMFLIFFTLIILGMLIEDLSLLIIMGPLLIPVIRELGIDPVQFGVILVLNLQMGMITPPVGMGFYITCDLAGVGFMDYTKEIIPYFLVIVAVASLMILFPQIVTWVPNLVFGS